MLLKEFGFFTYIKMVNFIYKEIDAAKIKNYAAKKMRIFYEIMLLKELRIFIFHLQNWQDHDVNSNSSNTTEKLMFRTNFSLLV